MRPYLKGLRLVVLVTLVLSFSNIEEWVLFQTKHCEMYFPKKPHELSQTINSTLGTLNMNIYSYEVPDSINDDNLLYNLMETEYPDSLINSDKKDILVKFFRDAIDGAVSSIHGKLLSETIIHYEDYPGREIRIDFKDGLAVIKMHFYLVKNKLYMLQTITFTKNDNNESINKFMNSFKLIR